MPVIPPRLDDLDHATTEEILRGRIQLVAPEWTDHNDSDPGIAMIQLFSHLTEQIGYRLNRVPEKTYVEFLKLVGVRLAPAVAAQTRVAFTLAKPAKAPALLIPAGTQISAKGGEGGPPPDFETDAPLDVLPVQIAALITTQHGLIDINGSTETGPGAVGADPQTYIDERYSLVWDGKTPKHKDMPTQPVEFFAKPSEAAHKTIYIGLAFNQAQNAGFKGARAALHLQLDNDEQPDEDISVLAGGPPLEIENGVPGGPAQLSYEYYRPPLPGVAEGSWEPLILLGDETDDWTRSGSIRFDVPMKIGPIPAGSWVDVETDLPHPLVGSLKTPIDDTPDDVPISGWIRVRFEIAPQIRVRSLNFNTVSASNLKTVRGERLGRGSGAPGQTLALAQQNVSASSLVLVSRDATRAEEYLTWQQVEDFDAAGPNESVFVLDAEAGLLIFGDGVRGRPPQTSELMIATEYRHGGGVGGDVPTGAVSQPSGLPAPVSAAINVVPARGGRDAETLEGAKLRAPKAFRMRERAVTAADYEQAALEAPAVRVARASVVPLRRPYPEGHLIAGQLAPGINMEEEAAGAITAIVAPERGGAYPMPTAGDLTAVAAHLDTVRLLTTEVHVMGPQYVRLFELQVAVRAAPGYTRTVLREAIIDHLRTRFHVLTGGPDGTGYPFGGGLHHADLVAEVFAVPGVDRVEALQCLVDGRTPDGAEHAFLWRFERRMVQRLTNCVEVETDLDRIVLLPDEVPFIDPTTLTVTVVGAP